MSNNINPVAVNSNELEAFKASREKLITKLRLVSDEVQRDYFQGELDACDSIAGLHEVESELRNYIASLSVIATARKSTGRGLNVADSVKADVLEQVQTANSAGMHMSYKAIAVYAASVHNCYLSPSMISRIIGATKRQSVSVEEKIKALKSQLIIE